MIITIAVEVQTNKGGEWTTETLTVTDEKHVAERKVCEIVNNILPKVTQLNTVITSIYVV